MAKTSTTPSPPAALIHNDWRLDNMMFNVHDPGQCVAVFDWDMCTLGDPLVDLGIVLANWHQAGESLGYDSDSEMPSTKPGFLTRREAVARYCKRRNVDASTVPYYHVFGLFKNGVVVQQIYYRYHVGQTKDQRFQMFGQFAELYFQRAKQRSESPTV
jgi:aminoglycoside phosphotransferase (APT) family kinase protein